MKKVTAEEFEAMKSIDNLECFTEEQVKRHLLSVNSEISKSIDDETKERRIKEIQSLQPIEVHDWHEQTASIIKSIVYVRENQLQSEEEGDQIHKSYADTELNRELKRVGRHVYSEEIEKAGKAGGHKYFKREGSPGNYKYYYTEAQYKKEKGSGGEKKGGEGKIKEGSQVRYTRARGMVPDMPTKGEVISVDSDGKYAKVRNSAGGIDNVETSKISLENKPSEKKEGEWSKTKDATGTQHLTKTYKGVEYTLTPRNPTGLITTGDYILYKNGEKINDGRLKDLKELVEMESGEKKER